MEVASAARGRQGFCRGNSDSEAASEPGSDASSTTYYHGDQIGSTRMVTNGSGGIVSANEFYPYGQGPQPTAQNHYLFSGKERDSESGLDYFGARYYASGIGRFMSADWSAQAQPVPYAKLEEPQTLNLYAYVRNNPISLVDPDGHWVRPDGGCCAQLFYPDPDTSTNMGANERKKAEDAEKEQKGARKPGFWRRLGQRLVNGFTGHGFKTNEQLTFVSTHKILLGPNFYSASVTVGVVSQAITYVPSTNNLYYQPGPGVGTGVALTAGKATDPNGFSGGPSASGCYFALVGGCVGASTSGDTAIQVGLGVGGWGASSGYGIDPVSMFMNEAYQNLPDKTGMPTYPAGGLQWDDPYMDMY